MKKRTVLILLLDLIFLIVFNVIFFLWKGTDHPAAVWIAYGVIHFAYLLLLLTPLMNRSLPSNVAKILLNYASLIHFIVQFIAGVVLIVIGTASVKVTIIIHLIIFAIYAVIVVMFLLGSDGMRRLEEKQARVNAAATRQMNEASEGKRDANDAQNHPQ